MTKTNVVRYVSNRTGLTLKEAQMAVDAFCEAVRVGVRYGENVTLPGFGTLVAAATKPRKVCNPRTGEEMELPADRAVQVPAGKGPAEAPGRGERRVPFLRRLRRCGQPNSDVLRRGGPPLVEAAEG